MNIFVVVTFADIIALSPTHIPHRDLMAEVTLLSTGSNPEGH